MVNLNREVSVLCRLQQFEGCRDFVVELFHKDEPNRALILEEGGQNLDQVMKNPDHRSFVSMLPYVEKSARILQFLHSHKVVWGDLKPQNLVLFGSSGSVSILKAVDFDSSVILSDQGNNAFGGNHAFTSHYGSPERLEAAFSKRDITATTSMDIWSFGILAYWLVKGGKMFWSDAEVNSKDLFDQSVDQLESTVNERVESIKNDSWRHVIEDCLKVDAHARMSADEVLQRGLLTVDGSCRPSVLAGKMTEGLATEKQLRKVGGMVAGTKMAVRDIQGSLSGRGKSSVTNEVIGMSVDGGTNYPSSVKPPINVSLVQSRDNNVKFVEQERDKRDDDRDVTDSTLPGERDDDVAGNVQQVRSLLNAMTSKADITEQDIAAVVRNLQENLSDAGVVEQGLAFIQRMSKTNLDDIIRLGGIPAVISGVNNNEGNETVINSAKRCLAEMKRVAVETDDSASTACIASVITGICSSLDANNSLKTIK